MKHKLRFLVIGTICILFIKILLNVSAISINNAVENKSRVIPIAMSTDDNYVYPTIVSITSILQNKNQDTYIKFYILVSENLSAYNYEKLMCLKDKSRQCEIKIINMKNKYSSAPAFIGHITTAAYYRLDLPLIIPEYSKIIYLDVDTIIRRDLCDFYDIDIGGYYVGGVLDQGIMTWSNKTEFALKLGIKDMNQYINSGVLLINLEEMRHEHITTKFTDYLSTLRIRNLQFHDQDVINAVCYEKIKLLPPEYNAMQSLGWDYNNIGMVKDYFSVKQWQKACSDPTIIHYISSLKPWRTKDVRFYSEWDKYRRIAEDNIYKTLPDGTYSIHSALNNSMVLDICEASKDNGANLQLWEAHHRSNQKFHVRHLGEGYYEIESLNSGKVFDVKYLGESSGTDVWQYEKNFTNAQKWLIKSAGGGYFYIISKCNGLCLDVSEAKQENGTNIQVWQFNGTNAQKFKFIS